MTKIKPTSEFIQNNYKKTIGLLQQFKLTELEKLVENFAEEYATAPASTDEKYHCAFPGGLCYHNLHVLQWLGRFNGAMTTEDSPALDKASMLKVAVLHNFAKVGEEGKPFYLPTREQWKTERGIFFESNQDLPYLRIPQRSLYLAQTHGVPLTQDEYLAILLADGQLDEVNRPYKYKEPKLATALHYAVYWSRNLAKEFKVSYP